eukprot:TRINITY_DN3128_c0_g4_i1.p1 TRINITY_DN3128_c0_g4~~TRINITY_DN3128_c0_g4_i1.p1  ORF type:complete len:293 (+),score=41.70 TRINITY_DN3128_c0_g4_i1:99-977(+)
MLGSLQKLGSQVNSCWLGVNSAQLILIKWQSKYSKVVKLGDEGVAGIGGATAYLQNPRSGSEIYLVGVDHLSESDVSRVTEVIRAVKPRTIVLQLDEEQQKELLQARASTASATTQLRDDPWWRTIFPAKDVSELYGPLLGCNYMTELSKRRRLPGLEQLAAADLGQKMGAFVVNGELSTNKIFQQVNADITSLTQRYYAYRLKYWKPEDWKESKEVLENKLQTSPELYRELRKIYQQRAPKYFDIFFTQREQFLLEGLLKLTGRVVMPIGWRHVIGVVDGWEDLIKTQSKS